MQQNAFALPRGGHGERTPIPETLAELQDPADARQRRLGRERDEDLAVKLRRRGTGLRGDSVIPQAVQILPTLARELRAWVFAPRVFRGYSLAPLGHQRDGGGFPMLRRGRAGHEKDRQ